MAHTKWADLKHRVMRSRMESVVWNGENLDELTDFAYKHGFGFSVGSPIRCNMEHSHGLDDDDTPCEVDKTVLEVYTADWFKNTRGNPAVWTHADVGDIIFSNGYVEHHGPPVGW